MSKPDRLVADDPPQYWSRIRHVDECLARDGVSQGFVQRRREPRYHGQQVPQKAATGLNRYGYVEEVAALVAFVAGPESSYIAGANLSVDCATPRSSRESRPRSETRSAKRLATDHPLAPRGWLNLRNDLLRALGMTIARVRGVMLRITVEDEPQQVTLRLEGRLAGAWVKELEDAWREVDVRRSGRPLSLDVSAVDHVDQAGEYLLALVARRGVRLIATGVAMRDLCRKIEAGWPHNATTG